jgi:hypothetical protein
MSPDRVGASRRCCLILLRPIGAEAYGEGRQRRISGWTSTAGGRRGGTGLRPWRNEGQYVGPFLTLGQKDQLQQLDMTTVRSLSLAPRPLINPNPART